MANCCGGKNAGQPISWLRYLAGVAVFFGYHGTVAIVLHVASIPFKRWRQVRDFHRRVFFSEAIEVLRRRDINVNGRALQAGRECGIGPERSRSGLTVMPNPVRDGANADLRPHST
jgi:hypothetical protein